MEGVDGAVSHWLTPIVAWRITGQGAVPVLASGDECSFMLLPSGQVDELFCGLFDNIDDAKTAFFERTKG